jgi:hypothetical protein
MYAPGPSEAELAAIGITREDIEDTSITEIWPENYDAFMLFSKMGTQWVCGPSGAIGLSYPSVIEVSKLYGIKKRDRLELLNCIQVMEQEALKQMRESS